MTLPERPPITILTAPTAAGKSALALALAQKFPLELVCADAFTVYRGLDIGTAKATPQERRAVPHHLLDVAEVHEAYDVARFVHGAEEALAGVLRRGNVPLVVGGTGFYLSALMHGLPLTPPADLDVRAAIEAELHLRGLDALLAEIQAADPAEAARMERNPRRTVRAVELLRRTGKLPGQFGRTAPAFAYRVSAFTLPPDELAARMDRRIQTMLTRGWPEEAAWLAAQVDPQPDPPLPRPTVWQALGYREALAVQRGDLSKEEAQQRILLASRQYAKRQLTYLRTQLHAPAQTAEQVGGQLMAQLAQAARSGQGWQGSKGLRG